MRKIRGTPKRHFHAAVPVLFAMMSVGIQSRAQGTPIPFINTVAGGGTPCSNGIPVYAVGATGKNLGDGCPATQSTINTPIAAAADHYGNVFIADQTDDLVRVIYNGSAALAAAIVASNIQATGLVPQPGHIYTIAGGVTSLPATATTYYCNQQGTGQIASDRELNNCPGVQTFIQPRGIAVDSDGNVFISNLGTASQMSVFYVGGAKAAALITLENPTVINPQAGYTYEIAGKSYTGYTGDGGLASAATVNTPRGIFVDAAEDVYFADTLNNVIRRIDGGTGKISTVAGHCVVSGANCTVTATSGDGSPATSSSVNIDTPYGVVLDSLGNIFIAEGGTSSLPGRVRVVYTAGVLPGLSSPVTGDIYTYAGAGAGTTPALQTSFQLVYGVSVDPSGYLYVTDYRSGSTGSNKIWRVDPTSGSIVAVAGNGGAALTSGAHCNGGVTGPVASDTRGDGCPATQAYLNNPQESFTSDGLGNFYIADRNNNVIRSFNFDNSYKAITVGSSFSQQVAIFYPATTTVTSESFVLQGVSTSEFSDAGNDTCTSVATFAVATTCVYNIKFAPADPGTRSGALNILGTASAVVASLPLTGIGSAALTTIDSGTSANLGSGLQPLSLTADESGNVYISDGKSRNVYRATGGAGSLSAVVQVTGVPAEIAVDPFGDIFVADSTANSIDEAVASSKGGGTASFGSGLSGPQGVATDASGNLYIADTGNNRLLYLSPITSVQAVVYLSTITLSAPTSVTLDSAGDVFILDTQGTRLVELPVGGAAQTVNLPSGVHASAIVFDPAGDVLVADKTSDAVLLLSSGFSQSGTIASGLTSPAGVAFSPNGYVYVADSASTSVLALNRSANSTTFPTTNIGLTSLPSTLTLTNEGNASTALATPQYTASGSAAAFPLQGSSTCASGLTLGSGSTCAATFAFQPTAAGPQSAMLSFLFSSGSTLTASFSGTATNLILTSLSLSVSPSQGVTYGQGLTLSVTLSTAKTGPSSPSGTIQLMVDGKLATSQTVNGTQYTFPLALSVGTHALAVTYSGDSVYAASNATTSVTVSKAITTTSASYMQSASGTVLSASIAPATTGALAPTGSINFFVDGQQVASSPLNGLNSSATVLIADGTHTFYASYSGDSSYLASSSATMSLVVARTPTTVTLSILPISSSGTGELQLTATLQTSGSGTPSGTITFTNAGTPLGKITLSGNSAVFTTSSTSFTSYSFTASYSGDGLFQPSTVTVTEGPDFVVTTPTTPLAVPQGGQATESVTITPINGYSGTITATCSNLPLNSLCRFQPIPVVVTTGGSSILSVQVFVGYDPTLAFATSPTNRKVRLTIVLALFLPLLVLRRKGWRSLRAVSGALLLALLATSIAGCGNKTPAYPTATYITPIGSTAVTLTATDSNGLSRSAVFTVVVDTQ